MSVAHEPRTISNAGMTTVLEHKPRASTCHTVVPCLSLRQVLVILNVATAVHSISIFSNAEQFIEHPWEILHYNT